MKLLYNSTRDSVKRVSASQAILKGLCEDGGLFVPERIPRLPAALEDFAGLSYQETAYLIMREFLTDFTEEELRSCIDKAYDDKFDTPVIAPLAKVNGAYFLELYHGATIAFKDMALSILPHLMITAAHKNHVENDIVILTATSGDTGKAALAGFSDVPGTRIIVFYPRGGVSHIQELQMVTQKGCNAAVVSIDGNFDDAQNGVKAAFGNEKLKKDMASKGFQFSSANSINIGRLVPQIVYYVYAYSQLVYNGEINAGDEINFTVPTGNFGNILAAYYAKEMGLPVRKLICASNKNKVLYDFFQTGVYDRRRDFYLTSSPSMDILISSNLERLIYMIADRDSAKVRELMSSLSSTGTYTLTAAMRDNLTGFVSGYADEEETKRMIEDTWKSCGYVMDTHTAVAAHVYNKYRTESGDTLPTVIASTASPYKFAASVINAIEPEFSGRDDFELIEELTRVTGMSVPKAVSELRGAAVLHERTCSTAGMEQMIRDILSI